MLKAVGFTDADLKKPLIGVANTWIEIGPCNYHLRDLAVHVKDGIRARRRHADGVQHRLDLRRHHDGHRGHARVAGQPRGDRRLDRAGRARQRIRRPRRPGRLRQDDPGRRRWRWRGSTFRASCSTADRLRPGSFTASDVTIQDVFEAVGAHARRPHDRRRALRRSKITRVRAPARAADSSRPTRWRSPCEFLGIAALGSGSVPATDPRQGRRRARGRRARDGARRNGVRPRDIITRAAFENAIASVADDRRIDQRRAAPDRDRARSRRRRSRSTISTGSARACRCSPI